jgi:hypothetical protein
MRNYHTKEDDLCYYIVTKEETISDSTFKILDNIFLDQIKGLTQVFFGIYSEV